MEHTLGRLVEWAQEDGYSFCSISFANQGDKLAFPFCRGVDRGANLRMAGQLPPPRSGLRDQSTHERGLDQNRVALHVEDQGNRDGVIDLIG